jgi:hypothetical protein
MAEGLNRAAENLAKAVYSMGIRVGAAPVI